MHCPYCQGAAYEDTPECPRCGLTLAKANAFFGTVPALMEGLTDLAGVLTRKARRRILAHRAGFERRFPQSGFSLLTMELAASAPAETYAFWVFNRTGIAGELRAGASNRHVFLMLDTSGRRAMLTVGYGLEPFIGPRHLDACLAAAKPHFADGDYAGGVGALLSRMGQMFKDIIGELARTYGVSGESRRPAPEPAAAPDPEPVAVSAY